MTKQELTNIFDRAMWWKKDGKDCWKSIDLSTTLSVDDTRFEIDYAIAGMSITHIVPLKDVYVIATLGAAYVRYVIPAKESELLPERFEMITFKIEDERDKNSSS
jgi:hypothetical protein